MIRWRDREAAGPVPGDVLLHPAALGSLALLLLNDHVLKRAAPGLVTGKLSDVAAMVFCPLLIAAAYEIARGIRGRRPVTLRLPAVIGVCLAVAAGFAAMKLVPGVGTSYGEMVGVLRGLVGNPHAVKVSADRSDALAIVCVTLPGVILAFRARLGLRSTSV